MHSEESGRTSTAHTPEGSAYDRPRMRGSLRRLLARADPRSRRLLDTYVRTAPGPQNALDIFRGEWASKLPPPLDRYQAGLHSLFDDTRIRWLDQESGGVKG